MQFFAGRRLFLRIFLYFWIATLILYMAYNLASITLRPAWGFAARELLPYLGGEAADRYESGGAAGAAEFLDEYQRRSHLKAYLFTRSGKNVLAESAPERAAFLAQQLGNDQEIGLRRGNVGIFLGVAAKSTSGTRYIFVTKVPRTWVGRALSPNAGAWIPFIVTITILALIWYALARRLAMPAMRLRSTARQFASGDLKARVTDRRLLKGRDEFADLAREFNRMASQIQGLIGDQNRLVGDISHELGSPLARLQLAIVLARKQLGQAADAPLDRIQREAERLDGLSQQVLRFMRLESPPGRLEPVRVRLDEFMKELVRDSDFEASATGRRVLLRSTVESQAEVHPDLLRSGLENVIRNAIRYTAENTAVLIEVISSCAASSVLILVRDHGPGVREECLSHLFEPFYRVEPSRDRKSGGVGLGLSIARRAIEVHGGTIQARNWTEGGLEVEICLPLGA
jgi:two-component system sensor histidine kinase CpxA